MTKLFNITNFASIATWLIRWWLLICLGINIAYAENTLQDISFTALPGNKVQLRLTLATTATTPNTFSTDSPPRLVLDFSDTKLALPSRSIMIGIGAVRSVTAIEAEGRCRVVFYFVRKVTYDIKLHANTVLLNMDNGLNVAAQKTRTQIATVNATPKVLPSSEPQIQTPVTPPVTKVIATPSVSEPTAPPSITAPSISEINEAAPGTEPPLPAPVTTEIPMQIAAVKSGLQAIDFQRGMNGEGQILVILDNPNTVINLTEQGRDVIVEVLNTKLPKSLHQKLNVIDFATPVKTITTEPKDNDIQIKVQATGEYEYVAYQVDKIYTLEFSPLTPEKLVKNEQQKLMQQRKLMQQKKKEPPVYTGEKLTLNFQDIPVRSLLHLLGDFANSNVVISDAVKDNVTLRLKNVPWDQALDIVLKTKFLGQRKHNNVIYIAPLEDLIKQEQAVLDADQKELESIQKELETNEKIEELAPLKMELIQLNFAKAQEIADVLTGKKTLKNTEKDTDKSPDTNNKDNKDNKDLQQISTRQTSNDERLLSLRGSVTYYERTNSVIIQDTAEQMETVREIIAKLDVPQKQILIESRIVIADNNFSKELGVRFGWSGARNLGSGHEVNIGGGLPGHIENTGIVNHGTWLAGINGNPFGAGFQNALGSTASNSENLMVNLPASSANGSVDFLIGKIGSYLLQLELSAMQLEGRGEVISSPRVVASDNTEALIEQGVEIPYSVVSNWGTNTEFKPIKLALTVTPHITADNRINLELDVRKETPAIFGDDIGKNSRVVKTSILISNGETVSLGGVYEQTKTTSKKSVPVFGEIPVLGELFKNTANQDEQRELIIFVTPKILQPEAMKTAK